MNLKEDMKQLRTLHTALKTGLFMIIGVLFYLKIEHIQFGNYEVDMFFGIGLIMFIFFAYMSNYMYQSKIQKHSLIHYENEHSAIADFRSANIFKWALLEGASLFCAVLGYLNSNIMLFIIALIAAILLLTNGLNESEFQQNYKIRSN